MFFSKSLRLVSLVASLLPALLVSASPHSLAERAEPSIDLQLIGLTPLSDPNTPLKFDTVTLNRVPGPVHDNFYTVENGWYGEAATAEMVSMSRYQDWANRKPGNLRAFGHDGKADRKFYVIIKDTYFTLIGIEVINGVSNFNAPQELSPVKLFPIPGPDAKSAVVGGWKGMPATVKRFARSGYESVLKNKDNVLAYGHDGGDNKDFYIVFNGNI